MIGHIGKANRVTTVIGILSLGTSLITTGLLGIAPGVANATPSASNYSCSGGSVGAPTVIPEGTYGSVTVSGFCVMQGTYDITKGLAVESGGFLDASVAFGFPPYDYGAPCNVFVNVSGGVRVGEGASVYFGNGAGTGCPSSDNVVRGGFTATGAESVVVHGTTINGGFTSQGGGGGTTCEPTDLSPFAPYTDVEDSQINGGASISGLSTCWAGFIRNQVTGTVKVDNNTMGDPDAIEIGINEIHGSLACAGNAWAYPGPGGVPTNSFDGSPANPNTVTGIESGQCAGL